MQEISVYGIRLYFDESETEAGELARQACLKTLQRLQEEWGIGKPDDCRVYLIDSWSGFMFRAAPWPWKILLAATLPLWVFRVRRMWPYIGGWEQRYGGRRTVGVKLPALLEQADRSIGAHIFNDWESTHEHFQSIVSHELTHALTSHLKLPAWLKEGLAMLAVDRVLEKATVRLDSLEALEELSRGKHLEGNQRLDVRDENTLVYLYLHGYWLTRYIDETQPGLLRKLLSGQGQPSEYKEKIAAAYQKSTDDFWDGIDGYLSSYFRETKTSF